MKKNNVKYITVEPNQTEYVAFAKYAIISLGPFVGMLKDADGEPVVIQTGDRIIFRFRKNA